MKRLLLILFVWSLDCEAQKLVSNQSQVRFFSKAAIEDIKAENSKSASIFNVGTGDIVFSIPIKDFEFDKSLMKQHFNEKYMDSDKFPKASFSGKVFGYDPAATGEQKTIAKGKLSIHGIERDVEIPGTLEWTGDKLVARSVFKVKLQDHKIKIPKMLWQNIAEDVEVTIEFNYQP